MKLPKLVNHKSLIINRHKGFTLIELLIVITIIGILVAAGTYSWQGAQIKARDNRRKTDLKVIQQALEGYYQANGSYPGGPGWCTQISNTTWPSVKDALQTTYVTKVPQDPTFLNTTSDYFYRNDSASTYRLYSTLENLKDPEYILNALSTDYLFGCGGSNGTYHYKVTNP